MTLQYNNYTVSSTTTTTSSSPRMAEAMSSTPPLVMYPLTSVSPSPSLSSSNIKICRVCGDKAIGFNFNGLTCESCKSFFRRNAPKYEKHSCRKAGSCLIDFVTRKCCTKCRLNKCFSIGMKRELICSKLERESAGSSSSNYSEVDGSDLSGGGSTSALAHHRKRSNIERLLDHEIQNQLAKCSMPAFPKEGENGAAEQEDMISLEDGDDEPVLIRPNYYIELNVHEFSLIREIEAATETAAFYDESRFQLVGEVNDLIYALNLAETYIKKTIKFCKAINAFKVLSQDDQLTIMKDFFTELMLIRFCFVFNAEKDGIPVIEDEDKKVAVLIKLNLLYDAKKQNFLYYARHNLFRANMEFEHDATLRDLIIAQRLFKPRDNINHPEFIRYQYKIYNHLLNRYLEHKYQNAQKACEKVHTVMDILKEMNCGRDILEGIFVDVDPSQLRLVISEVFNLKC